MRAAGQIPQWIVDPVERFWSKVQKTDGCWLWTGSNIRGYGQYFLNGRNRKVHRIAYELLVGPIESGLTIDHLCRVKNCVNPKHLEVVTSGVNVLRGDTIVAANARKEHCPRGHPFDAENTRLYRGQRHCRTCNVIRMRKLRRTEPTNYRLR